MARSFHAARLCAIGLCAWGVLLWTPCAGADGKPEAKGETVAVVVEGDGGDAIAPWLEDRVRAPDTLREGDAFRSALRSRGALPLRAAARGAGRDAQLIARARAAARETDVDRAILVDLHRTARGARVHVWAIDLQHPGAAVDSDVTLPASATAIDATRAILGLLPAAAASAEASPASATGPAAAPVVAAAAESSPTASASEPDSVAAPAAPAAAGALLELQAGVGVGSRHFSYVERVTPSLRPYDLAAAPLAAVSAVVYPLSFTRIPGLRDLGVTGEYARAFGVSSQDSTGTQVGTTWQSFDVGATERIAVGRAVTANVSLGYGGNDFQFNQGLSSAAAALPGVAYRFVRAGADVHVTFLSAFTAFGGGSYMDMLDTGATGQLFPRESVGGVEGHLGAAYALAKNWQVSLSAAYTRVFYSVNPVPGDTAVAGGALDEQTRLLAAFSYLM